MMELCIISFTQKGNELAKSVKMRFIESAMRYEISVFTAKKEVSDAAYVTDLKEWAGECFLAGKAILFPFILRLRRAEAKKRKKFQKELVKLLELC